MIVGLLKGSHLNGKEGVVIRPSPANGHSEAAATERFIVRLDDGGRELSVKIGNVEKIER